MIDVNVPPDPLQDLHAGIGEVYWAFVDASAAGAPDEVLQRMTAWIDMAAKMLCVGGGHPPWFNYPSPPAEEFIEWLESSPIPPGLRDVEHLKQLFYKIPGNGAGGSLHVVLDDGNWERSSVEFCRDSAIRHDDDVGRRFAEWILASLTDEQMHHAFCKGYDEHGNAYVGEHPCLKAPA